MKTLILFFLITGISGTDPLFEVKTGLNYPELGFSKSGNSEENLAGIWQEDEGCLVESYELISEKNLSLGTVSVLTRYGRAFVKYELYEAYRMIGAHLFVGDADADMPVSWLGKPKPALFPYVWDYAIGSRVVILEADMEGINRNFDIAAHAIITSKEGKMEAWARDSKNSPYVSFCAEACFPVNRLLAGAE